MNKKFKITPEMMNLLGCTKENFFKLMGLMNYKKSKDSDTYYFSSINKINIAVLHYLIASRIPPGRGNR